MGRPLARPDASLSLWQRWRARLLIVLLAACWLLPGVSRTLEDRLQSLLLLWQDAAPTPAVTLVAIDEGAIDRLGPWPWPRSHWAELLQRLQARHAPDLVALDVVFPVDNAQREGNRQLAATLNTQPAVIGQLLLPDPGDRGLAAWAPLPRATPDARADLAAAIPRMPGVLGNAPPLTESSAVGHINAVIEPDGLMRRAPALLCQQAPDRCSPSLFLAMADVLLGEPDWQIRRGRWYLLEPAWILSPGALPELQIPLDEHLQTWIPWQPRPLLPYVSAADLWDGTLPPGRLDQRILLFGGVSLGLGDIATSPLQRTVPGMEVHGHLLHGWLAGNLPHQPVQGRALALAAAAVLAIALLLAGASTRRVTWVGLTGSLLLVVAMALAWHAHRVMLPLAAPLFFALTATLLLMLHGAVLERREILSRIEPYLPPPLRRLLGRNVARIPDETGWGTILVADILGYTRLSRTLPLGQVAAWCDRGIDHILHHAHVHGGLLDNVAGDGALLLWRQGSDIEQAAAACAAAHDILAGLPALNQALAEIGLPPLAIGIGIHAGPYLLGSFGTGQKRYTVVSEAANLAAHIERQTRRHPWPILFSQTVADALPPGDAMRVAELRLDESRTLALYTLNHLPAFHWPITATAATTSPP